MPDKGERMYVTQIIRFLLHKPRCTKDLFVTSEMGVFILYVTRIVFALHWTLPGCPG